MSRRKKLINNTDIPRHKIEAIARPFCVYGVCFFFLGPLGFKIGLHQSAAEMGGFAAIKENNKSEPIPDWE